MKDLKAASVFPYGEITFVFVLKAKNISFFFLNLRLLKNTAQYSEGDTLL